MNKKFYEKPFKEMSSDEKRQFLNYLYKTDKNFTFQKLMKELDMSQGQLQYQIKKANLVFRNGKYYHKTDITEDFKKVYKNYLKLDDDNSKNVTFKISLDTVKELNDFINMYTNLSKNVIVTIALKEFIEKWMEK